jgi:hypothetical protein
MLKTTVLKTTVLKTTVLKTTVLNKPVLNNMKVARAIKGLVFFGLCTLISACIPAAQTPPPNTATALTTVLPTEISFYPKELGLKWQYILAGEPTDKPPFERVSRGITLFNDVRAYAFDQLGRGTEQTWYRTYESDGVYLHGFSKPGAQILITPPMREYPASTAWAAGYKWRGNMNITISYEGIKDLVKTSGNYSYTILEQRTVSLNGNSYKAWLVNRQISGDAKALFNESQDLLFVPYLGEIKTAENMVLLNTNFKNPS